MRYEGGLKYAVLGVVSRNPGGIYGYALSKEFHRLLGNFWQVNLGEVYRVLDHLSNNDLIEQVRDDSAVNRRLFRITAKGRQTLDDFVLSPATDAPRPLRQELAVKLLFVTAQNLPEILAVIDRQRAAYMQQLGMLEIQRRKLRRSADDCFVTQLLIDGAELSARAELAWLDDTTEKLKRRFSGKA
jgi:DNA-binding PadR family transcriptional regulator